MKKAIVIIILSLSIACPASAHGFALVRYIFNGVANQLGLDRGPIPKAIPTRPYMGLNPHGYAPEKYPDAYRFHIQADGF
jgi:hypothetical protein